MSTRRIDEIAAAGGTGLAKLRELIVSYTETMTTDYGKSLVRFDIRDLTEHNRKIVRLAKKKIDRAFRDYIGQGIKDGSIRPCDVKLSAFAIAGSLNWIGHWYQPGGALEAEAIAEEFAIRLTEGLAIKSTRERRRTNRRSGNASHREITVNITHGLRRALQINPNGLAIVYGDRRRNWREVGDRVARLAADIRALGAQAGDRVAILSLDSDRYLGSISRRLGRRRDRAAQHPLEPARERGRDARMPRRHPVRRQGIAAVGHDARQRDPGPQADLCR